VRELEEREPEKTRKKFALKKCTDCKLDIILLETLMAQNKTKTICNFVRVLTFYYSMQNL